LVDKKPDNYRGNIVSSFNTLSKDEKIELLSSLVLLFKEKPQKNVVPIIIFDNDELSTFETLAKYMKENLRLKFVVIASLLNRSEKTIWTTYNKARKKFPAEFASVISKINIPIESFSDRRFTVFESLVLYLKDYGLTNHEIAVMLHRDDRTIWGVYDRVKKKKK
tara:strand:- start:132 stop:626 length:495 start_codon:yes stop_codon:yes gene_type:complete